MKNVTINKCVCIVVMVLLLSGCDSKTKNDANATNVGESPTTQSETSTNVPSSTTEQSNDDKTIKPQNEGSKPTENKPSTDSTKPSDNSSNAVTVPHTNPVTQPSSEPEVSPSVEPSSSPSPEPSSSPSPSPSPSPEPTLKSVVLSVGATELNKDTNTSIVIVAKHTDKSEKNVTHGIKWIMVPKESVTIVDGLLIAKNDGTATVQAEVEGVLSNVIALNIMWEVNGHTLPPEPDPVKNDETLLGIDSNNDGVRDDIERKVYATYLKAIQRAVMMQAFRAEQEMLGDPEFLKNSKEWSKREDKVIDCNRYLFLSQKQIRIKQIFDVVNEWQFDTEERVKKYFLYDRSLSGGEYSIKNPIVNDCEFDIDKVLGMDK